MRDMADLADRASSGFRTSVGLRTLAATILVAGVALSLAGRQAAERRQMGAMARRFDVQAQHLADTVDREIRLFVSVLSSLGPLHGLSDRISASDFEEFAGKGLIHQQSVLGGFGLAQRIPLNVRAALELDPSSPERLSIVEPGGPSGFQPAGLRPDYYPITYQNPEDVLGVPVGFDLAAVPGQAEAIERMHSSRRPVLGAPTLHLRATTHTGFFVCAPILDPAAGTNDLPLSGFTVAILWPQALLQHALEQSLVRDVRVAVFDPQRRAPDEGTAAPLRRDLPLRVVDADWRLRAEALPAYLEEQRSPLPVLVGLGGSVIAILLALQVWLLASRAAVVERLVRERTQELQDANLHLSEEMDERVRLENEIHAITTREKQRIGQDLHDSLGQKLTGAVFLSRALAAHLGDGQAEARDQAEKINGILKDAVTQVRRTARGLAPVAVGEDGLAHAMRRLAEETCDVFNIACSFRAEAPPPVHDPQVATHLYHLAQEAVSNAIRHGAARDILIRLEAQGTGGRLVIEDDGRGLPPDAERREGAGLRIMRHRARAIGGTLAFGPRAGGGTRVTCEFPV